MSYDSKELSVQDSAPVWLVKFVQGTTEYRYTTVGETMNRSAVDWFAAALDIGRIGCSGDVPKDQVTLRLPRTNPLAATFLGYPPDVITSVTIFRTHYDDTGVLTAWKGRVSSSGIDGQFVTLTCEPIFSSLKRKGLRPVYQRSCRYALGGRGCNVDLAGYTHSVSATAATGAVVTVPSSSGISDLEGGTLTYGGVTRMILSHSGTAVTIMRPIEALLLALAGGSVSVTLVEGCDHSLDGAQGCRAKFGNAGNFGGFPGIPDRNPMGNTLQVIE